MPSVRASIRVFTNESLSLTEWADKSTNETNNTAHTGTGSISFSDSDITDSHATTFVAQGSGSFVNGSDRHSFATGDVLFVPAGVVHRFEDFTADLSVWVVFYGPEGGEATT